nr:hypothetical protein [Actinomycetota bacterium]NIU21757.1 hypothetical protein [Actinomycetota bacterium]NIV58288.1 hypothetical protein [Actinomycetota bacterium]NIX53106.1 hypothetical protein [Actinomycetota bacterium]
MTRLRWLVFGVLVALLAASCRVEATVEVEVDAQGSGTVVVTVVADADAVARIPDAPDGLRFDDLLEAGWSVEGPNVGSSGALTLTATKGFADAAALPGVLAEIAGDGVIFRDIELTKEHSFDWIGLAWASTDYALTGTIDPDFDITAFGDQFLPENIPELGQEPAVIESEFPGTFEEALGLTFRVQLEGDQRTETGDLDDGALTWTAQYGDAAIQLDASSSVQDVLPRVWAIVAILAFLLLMLILLSRLASYGLAILRTPKGRRRRDIRKRQNRAATREQEANRPRRRLLRLLVVDVHGVLVRPTDPLEGLLLPLVMAERPEIDPQRVRELHRQVVLGRISVEEFWSEVGLGPVADEIETKYLSSFRLVPGLHPFLDRMSASRLPVAAVGNQPRAWGDRLRRMAAL